MPESLTDQLRTWADHYPFRQGDAPIIRKLLRDAADRIDTLEQAIHLKPRTVDVVEGPPDEPCQDCVCSTDQFAI